MGKRITYVPYDHFMLRAPLLPVDFLSAIPGDYEQLFPWLQMIWKDPLVREGLMLGSLEFSTRVDKEFAEGRSGLPDSGLLYSLVRYLCRFSSRCTPYGTFAGFATGMLGSATEIMLGEKTDHKLHARPDMELLMRIARLLEADPVIREKLIYTGNTSLYAVGSRWHFVEVKIPEGKIRKQYDIVTIDDSGVIGGILDFCRNGSNLGQIRNYLIERGWEADDVSEYVNSLVGSQVIVSDLEPVICGPEYMDCLLEKVLCGSEGHEIIKNIVDLKILFNQITRPSSVLPFMNLMEPVLAKIPVPVNPNHLIQVDMQLKCSSLKLDSKVAGKVLLGLRIIKALSANNKTDSLMGYREAFSKRYGDRRIQLVKTLDPETGIGLEGSVEGYWTDPVPWIDDLRWGPAFTSSASEPDAGNIWLAAKFIEVVSNKQQYLSLESSDLQSIGIHDGIWPSQMTAMVELFDEGSDGESGIHLLMGSSGNPSYLLGRFGFADPDATFEWIRQLIADDRAEQPEAIFAEVVHLPEDRTGNILQRPAFLDYEIPYLARSAKSASFQIPVTDLMVGLENNRMVLYSRSSGKRIIPCMTNAYNHQLGNLAVYKFLNRIQYQDPVQSFRPDWGEAARHALFVPGIRFKDLILAPPVWVVRCSEIARWIHPENNVTDHLELLDWKNGRQMPDDMVWMSHDQELYFNWNNPNLILALWDTIRKYAMIRVRPYFLTSGTPIKSPEGSHANQVIFCYRKS